MCMVKSISGTGRLSVMARSRWLGAGARVTPSMMGTVLVDRVPVENDLPQWLLGVVKRRWREWPMSGVIAWGLDPSIGGNAITLDANCHEVVCHRTENAKRREEAAK